MIQIAPAGYCAEQIDCSIGCLIRDIFAGDAFTIAYGAIGKDAADDDVFRLAS